MSEFKNKEVVEILSKILKGMSCHIVKEGFSDNGFYCDFYTKTTISTDDFPKILEKLPEYTILTSVSGLNLQENNLEVELKDLYHQRIHGKSFNNQEDLTTFNKMEAELSELDHRHLGSMLDLFYIDAEICPGMVTWLPKGVIVLEKIKRLIRETMKSNGYNEVITPQLANLNLWKKSGHWEMYNKNMFTLKAGEDETTYALKPMSCPLHIEIFKNLHLSYKDLPYKLAEFGCCTRYEPSGSLHGLFRVRAFTQDDAHVFCTQDQVSEIVIEFINILQSLYASFGFQCVKVCLATRPDQFVGQVEDWDKAEKALEEAAIKGGIQLAINPGDGAFYGPKLEFYLEDSRKRVWQCGTVQLDFVLAKQLEATYISKENYRVNPVMIHHAVLGTIERFLGVLLEDTKGKLPFWLAPLQIIIIPIHSDHLSYSQELRDTLSKEGFTCEIDQSQNTIRYKIRKWWSEKRIPIILILGNKEMQNRRVSLRVYGQEEEGDLTQEEFLVKIKNMGKILE